MKKILIFICVIYIFVSKVIAFSDSNDFYWAKDSIDKWSQKGFISGYPDGSFRGNSFITRAEVISVINKINNSKENIDKRVAKDVETDNWFFYEIGKGVKTGIISIDEDGKFRPNDFATREEVMVILSKLFNINYSGKVENSKISSFSDYTKVNSKDFYRVAGIVEEGVIAGYPDNTLRPDGNITRAEFITILSNLIKEVFSRGDYNNKVFKGNIVINDENVKITNSEIYGKVFVLDGAKNDIPELINTKVSKGVNSRVGGILIKDEANYQTLSEYNANKPDDYNEVAIAKIIYSEDKWTNDDVRVNVKFNDKDVEFVDDERIIAKKNGEYEVRYIYDGKLRTVNIDVNNIDNIKPDVKVSVETKGRYANILVDIVDDGLSPIKEIRCSNGMINKIDNETGEIDKKFLVNKNGNYEILVEDEAGNIGKAKISVEDILEADVIYKIEHYLQEEDGEYLDVPITSNTFSAETNTNILISDITRTNLKDYTLDYALKDGDEVKSFLLTDDTLIKIYYKKEFILKYNTLGGINGPSDQAKYIGEDIALSSIIPKKDNCEFLGWSLEEDDVVPDFYSGDTYTENKSNMLYAVWYDKTINEPVLGEGMVAVNWNDFKNDWEEVSKDDWDYNYKVASKWEDSAGMAVYGVSGDGSARWANAVIDADNDGVNESFYVWIPRYSYKIMSGYHESAVSWNSDNYVEGDLTGRISVKFSDGLDDYATSKNGYEVHPAFTFGDKELTGIWVAKYEASRNDATEYSNGGESIVTSRPGVRSLRNLSVSEAYEYSYGLNRSLDSHLMKNIEWGAVAYLTNAIGRIPYINNCNSFITGNAGESQDTAVSNEVTNVWNTVKGVKASSTHNIYGIYDLAGGAREMVSAYVANGGSQYLELDTANKEYAGVLYANRDTKYVDVYASSAYDSAKKGDAVFEISEVGYSKDLFSWDLDYSFAPHGGYPVFSRGGICNQNFSSGIFNFGHLTGSIYIYSDTGFRPVLAIN